MWSRVILRNGWRAGQPRLVPHHPGGVGTNPLAEEPLFEETPAVESPEDILRVAREEAEAIREAAREEGYRAGFAAGREEGMESLLPAMDEIATLAHEFAEARERFLTEVRGELLRLGMAVARKIIREEVSLRPEVLEGILDEALAEARDLGRFSLRLHPADYGALFERLREKVIRGEPLEVRPDPGLNPGDLVIEGENGTVDGRILRQLERLERSLGAVL